MRKIYSLILIYNKWCLIHNFQKKQSIFILYNKKTRQSLQNRFFLLLLRETFVEKTEKLSQVFLFCIYILDNLQSCPCFLFFNSLFFLCLSFLSNFFTLIFPSNMQALLNFIMRKLFQFKIWLRWKHDSVFCQLSLYLYISLFFSIYKPIYDLLLNWSKKKEWKS